MVILHHILDPMALSELEEMAQLLHPHTTVHLVVEEDDMVAEVLVSEVVRHITIMVEVELVVAPVMCIQQILPLIIHQDVYLIQLIT